LLEAWLGEPFFERRPPKSTGREEYGAPAARRFIDEAAVAGVRGDDLVATLTHLTSESIVRHYRRFVIPEYGLDEVIIGGGGAYNTTLRNAIQAALPNVRVHTHEAFGIPSDAKESMAFALLAYLHWAGVPGNVPEATGARCPVVLGVSAPGARQEGGLGPGSTRETLRARSAGA